MGLCETRIHTKETLWIQTHILTEQVSNTVVKQHCLLIRYTDLKKKFLNLKYLHLAWKGNTLKAYSERFPFIPI